MKELWEKLRTRRIFGVPMLYLVGGLVGVLAVVAFRMRPAAGGLTTEEETQAASEDLVIAGDGPEAVPPAFVTSPPTGGVGGVGGGVGVPDPGASPDDNGKWLRRAAEWLYGQGHAPPDTAMRAMQRYLAGEQLSMEEGKLRDLAIKQFGYPPEETESGGTAPPPAAPKKYIAPGFHTVTGSGDDHYQEIARLWYGRADDTAVDLIQSYNVRLPHQGPLPVGTRLWIPVYTGPKYVTATASMRTAAQLINKNPPLNSVAMLQELNDGMKFPVAVGTRVRVA